MTVISPEDYEKFYQKIRKVSVIYDKLRRRVSVEYQQYLNVWNPIEANRLPPYRSINYIIKLKEGATLPVKRAYGMSRDQAAVVKVYVDKMLGKGYIRPSTSPYVALVLIVKKPDRGPRIYIDYRALNALTIKNRNASLLIRETMAKLYAAKVFTKFNIIIAFNKIRITKGDEEKTAFLTRYELYKYTVMSFGLCNAPSTF